MSLQDKSISEFNFEQCLKCTSCTVACPVAAVNPLYPGPKQAGPDGERLRLKNPVFYDEALKYCLNCKRCEVACPSGVRIGDIIQTARLKYSTHKPALRDIMLASTDQMGKIATAMAPIVNATVSLTPVKAVMDSVLKIDHRRTFPKYAGQKFETWFRKQAQKEQEKYDKKVSYFHGCYVNYNYPQLGKDFVKIMNALNYGVYLLDKEQCCGVALMSNGLKKQAIKQATNNLSAIRQSVNDNNRPVLTTSSTCTFTMRDEYPHVLNLDNADVRDHIEMATRFIHRLITEEGAKLKFKQGEKIKIAYHTPCHMERMGWSIYSIELLKMIPNVELTVLDSQCCGISGTYGFKKENYAISQAIGEPLFKQIEASGADFIATDCETCKWQIEMSTSKKVLNPISVLAMSIE